MLIAGLILICISVGILAAANEEHPILNLVLMFAATVGIALLMEGTKRNGIKEGAYNQLRGKYEVTYVINQDSIVTDTIINF